MLDKLTMIEMGFSEQQVDTEFTIAMRARMYMKLELDGLVAESKARETRTKAASRRH